MPIKTDTENKETIWCPHCGYRYSIHDSEDRVDLSGSCIPSKEVCLGCGKTFMLHISLIPRFTTR